jgi:Cof subfamily protein (haloacid dehalogenase superfamily)
MNERSRMRLLALDVDGTVLGNDHRVSPGTREAVRAAADSGAEIVLASSRGPGGLRPVFSELGTNGLAVAYQGALLCRLYVPEGMEVLSEKRLSIASARSTIFSARERGLSVGWYTAERWEVLRLDEAICREAEITGETPIVANAPASSDEPPHKVLCIGGSPDLVTVLGELASRLPEDCAGQFSHENYLEVTPRDVDKAPALKTLAEQLGVAREEIVAIGDGENDAGMIRWAGLGSCMGHAPDSVTEVADWVTGTNERDGVAIAVHELRERRWL